MSFAPLRVNGLALRLELEAHGELYLTLTKDRITCSTGYSKVRPIRCKAEVRTGECVLSSIDARHLIAVEEVKGLGENLQVH